MTERATAVIEDLLQSLEEAKFEVIDLGQRYRVTNPAGGRPVFIPHRLPKANARFVQIVSALTKIGFDVAAADARREADRQRRIDADKLAAAKVMEVAATAAAARANGEVGRHRIAALQDLADRAVDDASEPKARSEVIAFTPQFAEEFLRANRFYDEGATHAGRCNRKFRKDLAVIYRDAMLRGEWVVTNQGIGVDIDNELTDGQHRLMAVVLAGEINPDIVVEMQVTYDLPRSARDKVDAGRNRTMGDNLGMHGEHDTNELAATLRLLFLYDHVPYTLRNWRNFKLSTDQALAMLAAEGPEIRDAVRAGRNAVQAKSYILASAFAAGALLIRRYWPDTATEPFLEMLKTGAGLEFSDDPILAFRNNAANQRAVRRPRIPAEHLAMFVKTFNAYITGRRRVKIKWEAEREGFPVILQPNSTPSTRRTSPATGSSAQSE